MSTQNFEFYSALHQLDRLALREEALVQIITEHGLHVFYVHLGTNRSQRRMLISCRS
jgi:hypothetical protein